MPTLKDAKREKFAQLLAKGVALAEARKQAGFAANRKTGWKARRAADIDRRISELAGIAADRERVSLARAAVRYQVTTDRVIGELARIAFSNSLDYFRIDSNGEPAIDLSKVNRDVGAAISEIIVDRYMDGKTAEAREVKRIRIKLADKRAALVDLGRHLGLFVDPATLNLAVNNFFSERPPSMAEWRKEIELQANVPATVPAEGQGQTKKLRVINGKP